MHIMHRAAVTLFLDLMLTLLLLLLPSGFVDGI